MKHLTAFLLLCSTALAADPTIVGSPSLRVKVGNPPWVLLTVKDAPEKSVQTWGGAIGGTGVGLETKDGLGVSTAVPGTHSFRCVVQTPSEGLDPIHILDVTVVVEGKDGVIPPPPPPPVVETFDAKLTKAVAASPKDTHEGLGRVAKLYETVADQIKGGLLKTPEAVTTFTDSLTPVASPAWAGIKTSVVDPHLKTLTLATAADYEPVWRQIAAAVKAGLTDIPPPVVVDPPLPVTGLHLLVVEDKDARSKLPASQVGIFSSTKLKGWLDTNGVKWRMFHFNVDQTQLAPVWKEGMKRISDSGQALPAMIVSNGTKGFIGPLPVTEDDVILLVEKYK